MTDLHILIVEDESLIALELTQTIRNLGYHVLDYATNEALTKTYMQTEDINLILMDINLGTEQTGIELYKSLHTKIPVILRDSVTSSSESISMCLTYVS